MSVSVPQRRKEPAVVSIHLLTTALEAAADDAPSASSLPRPRVELHEATSLRLSYRGLVHIENLQTLRSLKTLRLDNNDITSISGLDCLAGSLEWLDLSFNAIERIEGLDSLTRLTDLTLFNNRITSVAGGLSGCIALQCLSLGNNAIDALLETVLYLRTLPALEVLTLSGNPLCRVGDGGRDAYRPYCHAFLPALKYLDYNLVTDEERRAAREGGVPAEKLAEVEEESAAAAKAASKAAERAAQLVDLQAANLEVVRTVYEDLFADDDADWVKVKQLPDMPRILLALKESLAPIAAELQTAGWEKNAKIKEEIQLFDEALAVTTSNAEAAVSALYRDWRSAFKYVSQRHYAAVDAHSAASAGKLPLALRAETEASTAAAVEATAAELQMLGARVDALGSDALRAELSAHERIETMLDMFDSALAELRVTKLALQETFFRAVEAAEGVFTEALSKAGEALLLAVAEKRVAVTDMDEDLGLLAQDKDSLVSALLGAHEARVARILKREGDLKAREERRCSSAVASAHAAETQRNRSRVAEITALNADCTRRIARALVSPGLSEDA